MDRYLICQICGEKLPFNTSCTCTLGEHLVEKHPGAEMTHFVVEDLSLCDCDEDSGSATDPFADENIGERSKKFFKDYKNKNGILKTTVESWKPGPMKVACPLCGVDDKPCIRKQKNKVAYTQLGAMCMVSCWPICFLPFLMPQASTIQLYCRHCGAFLGEYNRRTGTLKYSPADAKRNRQIPENMC